MGNIVIAEIPKCGLEKRCAKLQIYSDQTPVLISSERRKKVSVRLSNFNNPL